MDPTWSSPESILWAATHSIRIVTAYIINIRTGIINVITRFTNNDVFVRSLFALSKRSSSNFSLPNARITGIPVRISLDTRLTRSTRSCMILNFGSAIAINTPRTTRMPATATTITHPMLAPLSTTFMIPPTARTGAYKTMRSNITVTIWICWTSFVERVIRDAVDNRLISASENEITRLKMLSRRSQPTPAATLAATRPVSTADATINNVIRIISTPTRFR